MACKGFSVWTWTKIYLDSAVCFWYMLFLFNFCWVWIWLLLSIVSFFKHWNLLMLPMKPHSIHTTAKDQICSVWMICMFWNKKKLRNFFGFKATVCSFFCGASRLKLFVYMKLAESYGITKLRQLQTQGALWLTCLCVALKLHSFFCISLQAAHASMNQKNTFTQLLFFKTNHWEDNVL